MWDKKCHSGTFMPSEKKTRKGIITGCPSEQKNDERDQKP